MSENLNKELLTHTPWMMHRRQLVLLTVLYMFVLTALMMIHAAFGDSIGHPSTLMFVFIGIRFAVLVGEFIWLYVMSAKGATSLLRYYTAISIVVNLLFAYSLSYSADLKDTHYHVLMLIPIIMAAFQYSLGITISIATAASLLSFIQLTLYFQRHPPLDEDEFYECSMITVVYFLVGMVAWLLVRDLRKDRQTLARSLSELKSARDSLVSREKLAAVGRLASAVAHEIRNPVAMINSSLDLATRESSPSSVRQEMFDIALKESSRLERLTTDLLTYANSKTPQCRMTSVRGLFQYVQAVVRARLEKSQLKCELRGECLGEVCVDEFQIHQVMLNMVMNAIDASPYGATIYLSSRIARDECILSIENAGDPITESVVNRIFEPFFTTRPTGTGLGLAIARSIAMSHGGEVRLAQNIKGCIRFDILLPSKEWQTPSESVVYEVSREHVEV